MADKVTLRQKWFNDIQNDPNFETTEQELAYMMYAALKYGFEGEKVDLGEVFGKEFKALNRSMSNIYGQIDNIQNYDPSNGKNIKYDAEEIKRLRLEGHTAVEICDIIGVSRDKARSLTSNKGWKEAGEILKVQKCTDSVLEAEKVQKNTETIQKDTDLEQTENTESTDSVQDLSKNGGSAFEF